MKEKVTITIESELLALIEKNMIKANYNNKSKFVEYALNQLFMDPRRRLALYENILAKKAREMGEFSRYVHELQDKVDQLQAKEECLEITTKDNNKDALWTQ